MAAPAAVRYGGTILELTTDFFEIVNFAVVGEDETAICRVHRLTAGGRQIHDRKAPVSKADTSFGIHPATAVVGAPVNKRPY
jgi:hypothetical protein